MPSFLKPSLPLTFALPLFVAVAMFIVAVGTTQIGVRALQSSSETALQNQAVVFLDAVAGNIVAEIDDDLAAVQKQLAASLTFRTALLEKAMAARWRDTSGASQTVVLGDGPQDKLIAALDAAEAAGAGALAFENDPEQAALLVLKSYAIADGALFLSATFDTTPVLAAASSASRVAIGIDVLVAILAAVTVYAITRRALSPLDGFIARLADSDDTAPHVSGWRRGELQQLETALALRERSEAERAKIMEHMAQHERDALLARMAAAIAHEVRNPLAGLKNGISTLKRFGEKPEVRQQTVELLESGLDSIGRVVDVTLSTYRRRSGTSRLSGREIRDLDLLLKPTADQGRIALRWDIDETLVMHVDADALRQILVNLLLNSISVSPERSTITITLARLDDGSVAIGIADEGSGMPPEVVAAIISGQMDDVPIERSIGLWVVATLVQRIGASLSIHSVEERGTRVTLTLPPNEKDAT